MDRAALLSLLPHGGDFVFLDDAELHEDGISGSYTITGNECFARSHFPDRYVLPGSIMVQAICQRGVAY